jgi:K+-sensing histidine kinase KdpD
MKRIEDTILKHIRAGDRLCLVKCWSHDYVVLPESKGSRGGLAFSVIINPEPHMVHISLNLMDEYDVSLTRLASNGKIVTKESGTCQGAELAEVITSMCNRVEHTEVVTVQQVESRAAQMTPEELVDALRDNGYYLDLSVTQHRGEPTEYTARFWHSGVKPTPPWIWDASVEEVITQAALTIIKRDGLDFHQDDLA